MQKQFLSTETDYLNTDDMENELNKITDIEEIPIITENQIQSVILDMSAQKAMGPDHIPIILLTKSFEITKKHLIYIFIGILQLSYHPDE